jgi:holo-[acyl-carrier protein] synthase
MLGVPAGQGALAPGVIGVGIDVVAIDRFVATLRRTPALRERLFTDAELLTSSGAPRTGSSLAARFAVKEAVAKALGVPPGMDWHDCRVISLGSGRPDLDVIGTVAAAAIDAGVTGWQMSISHDAGIAAAVVIALGTAPAPPSVESATGSSEEPSEAPRRKAPAKSGKPAEAPASGKKKSAPSAPVPARG